MRLLSLAIALLCLAAPGPLTAQESGSGPEHRGFWVAFGLGGGTNLADFADGARAGVGGYLRLGGTISPKLLLGGEISGWGRDVAGSTFTESGMTAVAMFYPAGRGLFLKGGVGFAGWASSADFGGTTTTSTAGGFAGTAGVGYDLRIGSNMYLTPNIDFMYHTLESDNDAFSGISSGQVLMFTLGLTWH
jgi:hypothetical protein